MWPKKLSYILTQFSRPTCLRGQGVFYPCQDNDYNTLNVLLLFWVAFSHKGGSSWTLFSFKVFLLPSPCSTLPGPCSTVQLAIHSPKLLPQRIYICVQGKSILCTLGSIAVQEGKRHFWPKVYFRSCAWICRSAPYFLPQVSAFRPTQLRHSLRVKGRFPLKYVFVLGVTSR